MPQEPFHMNYGRAGEFVAAPRAHANDIAL